MEKMNLNIIINNPDFIKPTKKSQVLFILYSNCTQKIKKSAELTRKYILKIVYLRVGDCGKF